LVLETYKLMNLCIDIGNSRTKLAVYDTDNSLIKLIIREEITVAKLDKVLKKYQIQHVIVSSVKKKQGKYKRILSSKVKFYMELDATSSVPVSNLYESPETLGRDRLAAVVGASTNFPNSDILVIDAGTCVTYDLIDQHKNYFGGNILPGLEMRFKALAHYTDKLPLVTKEIPDELIGKNTVGSIQTGVVFGMLFEMKGMIAAYRDKFPDLRVIITGGDAIFFESLMENQIFAIPELVLSGLNQILNYNVST